MRSTFRVLVVDDDPTVRFVLARCLASAGFAVETACDGWAGVHAYFEGDFDAVLMDCQMPVMDGLEATRAIRSLGGWGAAVAIVAFTGDHSEELHRRCMEAGMDAVVEKPAKADELLAAARAGVRKRSVR